MYNVSRTRNPGAAMKPPRHLKPAPIAHRNSDFMESVTARPIRILGEYLDPLARFRREGIGDTIVMFGSARILPRDGALAHLRVVRRAERGKRSAASRERFHAAQRQVEMSRYYEEARELARRITRWARRFGDRPRRFVICSGGGPGIMEAANRGAAEAGGKSVGLAIEIPHEQRPNRFISSELSFQFHYFFMRKLWFAQLAQALIVFPGGFGTMDELWEMLTLTQTRKMSRRNLILIYGRPYWDEVLNWKAMLRWGTIHPKEYSLLQFADTVPEAFSRVTRWLLRHHKKLDTSLHE